MVKITLNNNLNLKIEAKTEYLLGLRDYFVEFVPGYRFMQKYKSGIWDGTVCLFDSLRRELPYGLFVDLLKFHKKNYKEVKISIDDNVKNLFKNKYDLNISYNLKYKPFYYQKECVEAALNYTKGIIKSPTSSGKSLIISYIIDNLKCITEKQLIIVPTINLVEQFYADMIDYGISGDIGRIHADLKEYDRPIVISTWQSMIKTPSTINEFDTVIVDETHTVKGIELRKLLKSAVRPIWRFGFTGTLPSNRLDLLNIKSYIGPIIKQIDGADLAKKGFISKCNIKILTINHNINFDGSYNDVKELVFNQHYRLELIKRVIDIIGNNNVLILVGLVEKEGELLKDYLEKVLPDKTVVFLSGKDKVTVREEWREEFKNRNDIILIATYGIYQMGINIPPLKYLIFASPFKSEIRILQSIGRTLRKHASKIDGSYIIDIVDRAPYIYLHAKKRYSFYKKEKFNIEKVDIDLNNINSFIF